MNKTTAAILGGAMLVSGAVIVSDTPDTSAMVEKIDENTVKITQPTNLDIRLLKATYESLLTEQSQVEASCRNNLNDVEARIAETKELIQQAKSVGVN